MNWRVKSALRHALLALPGGEGLYRWLTYQVIGSMSGMAAKWFRVFPERVAVLQKHFGSAAREQRIWCFDCGTTIAAGLVMAVASDEPGLLTDRWDRLSDRYCRVSRDVLRQKGGELAQVSHAPADRVDSLLRATDFRDAAAALAAVQMTYAGSHVVAESPEWRGRVGLIFSGGTLEHYSPQDLEVEVARMAATLRPGGVLSHVVDHRDHRWHADKSIGPLAHLTLDEGEYLCRFANPLEYHNRWLRSSYLDLFSRHGFTVEAHPVRVYSDDLVRLDRSRLTAPFAGASDEDLSSLVTHFVAVRS